MGDLIKYDLDYIVKKFIDEAVKHAETNDVETGTVKMIFPLMVTDDEDINTFYKFIVSVPKINGEVKSANGMFYELTEDEYLDLNLNIMRSDDKVDFDINEEENNSSTDKK